MFYLILEKEEVKTSHVRRRSMRCKKFPVFSSLLNNSRRYDNINVLFPKMYREKFSGYVKQQGLVLF